MPSTGRIPLFKSKEEAERETGHFSVSCIKITSALSDRISAYLGRENLRTWNSADHTKRYRASYTFKFEIKDYHKDKSGNVVNYAYIRKGCEYGDHKSAIEHSISMYGGGGLTPSEELHKDHELLRVREKKKRTPDLEKLYFWICRKYPKDILWVDYSTKKLSSTFSDEISSDDFIPFP